MKQKFLYNGSFIYNMNNDNDDDIVVVMVVLD